jgi:hypothetical protein
MEDKGNAVRVRVSDLKMIGPGKYDFTALIGNNADSTIILLDCQLRGPTRYGDWLVFGPTRWLVGGGPKELVKLPLGVRKAMLEAARAQVADGAQG